MYKKLFFIYKAELIAIAIPNRCVRERQGIKDKFMKKAGKRPKHNEAFINLKRNGPLGNLSIKLSKLFK